MAWYSTATGRRSHACLSMFAHRYSYVGEIKDFYFAYDNQATIDALKRVIDNIPFVLPSLSKIYEDMGLIFKQRTDDNLGEERKFMFGGEAAQPLEQYSAKQVHWAFNLLRPVAELKLPLSLMEDMDKLFETNIPTFLLWVMSHFWCRTQEGYLRVGAVTHSMFGEFNCLHNINHIMSYLNDAGQDDFTQNIKSNFYYWSSIKVKNTVKKEHIDLFKLFPVRSKLFNDCRYNEDVWFKHIVPTSQIILANLEV